MEKSQNMSTIIRGSGSYIPTVKVENAAFMDHSFYYEDGKRIQEKSEVIISKFQQITGIDSRRYVADNQSNSNIAYLAAKAAIQDAQVNPETIDLIIVAHNFGDVVKGSNQTDMVPSLASRVKNKLGIQNPKCVALDLIFGCPGWVQAMIQAHMFISGGFHQRCLIVGSEVLSRVIDPFDRDTMIFADGAGAVIVEKSDEDRGVLAFSAVSHCNEETDFLYVGQGYNHFSDEQAIYIKMKGRKIYEYALNHVPKAMKECMDQSGIAIQDLKKILIHQANEKMDEAIVKRFYQFYDITELPKNIMPMTIGELGNSSVATIPTLYDLIMKNQLDGHEIKPGDHIMFASVGAGMNINAIIYKA